MKERNINMEQIAAYGRYLRREERAPATVRKYLHDLKDLYNTLAGRSLTKDNLIEWKGRLMADYTPTTINSMLVAVNGFFRYMGWEELIVKLIRVQKSLFCDEHRELTRNEYIRLVRAAEDKDNERLSMILQTICATGIRVSELKFITVEAVAAGRAEITNKGKHRTVFLPEKLRRILQNYTQKEKKTNGAVFTTRTGKPLDRSNIWRDMKRLCRSAGVEPKKVFPHNLRHLFARTYYTLEKDLCRLADILGHSSIDTTRIYTLESGAIHARQMERLALVLTT